MSHIFQVDDKPIPDHLIENRPAMLPWLEHKEVQAKVKGKTLYASKAKTVGGTSPLFHSISWGFNGHCPVVITPDAVWLTILTGLTHHIDNDPEGLRKQFVPHEGKKELVVQVWSPRMPHVPPEVWEEGISKFSDKLKENLNPKRHELLVNNFSTSSKFDVLASEVALMGAMKHYFTYKMMLLCGLSKVIVLGTDEDWTDIINRTQTLSEFGLSWWTDQLVPVLQQIRRANSGDPDLDFWRRAYLEHRKGSGGQFNVSGWVNTFYPYISGAGEMQRNPYLDWEANDTRGCDPDDYPFGLSSVPVTLDDHGTETEYECEFYGGLVGVSMADDFTVRPESGIALQLLSNTLPEPVVLGSLD